MLAAASLKMSSEVPLRECGRTRYSLPWGISINDSLEVSPKRYFVAKILSVRLDKVTHD